MFSYTVVLFLMLKIYRITGSDEKQLLESVCSSSPNLKGHHLQVSTSPMDNDLVLLEICHNLNIYELCNFQTVCKHFQEIAIEEQNQRGPDIKIVRIYKTSVDENQQISHIIRVKPKVSLFYTDRLMSRGRLVSSELISRYMHELPRDSIIISVLGTNVLKKETSAAGYRNEVLGLFIPENQNTELKIGFIMRSELADIGGSTKKLREKVVDKLNQLQPDHDYNKPYGLILHTSFSSDVLQRTSSATVIIHELRKMYKANREKFSLWGSMSLFLMTNYITTVPDLSISSFGISITGPRIACWSLVINKLKSRNKIYEKVAAFKEKIGKINVQSVALSLQSKLSISMGEELRKDNKIFSQIFPNLELMIFSTEGNSIYCTDSLAQDDQEPQMVYNENHICYLVISYY